MWLLTFGDHMNEKREIRKYQIQPPCSTFKAEGGTERERETKAHFYCVHTQLEESNKGQGNIQ